ncbi:hypothetical protein HER32_16830 [Hymenobacter sp. BT18]|uniref:hypothetical protein n=1 Tax=Hymenobacter sp. BT18 TaxID=2835648 RepID=UPI00143EBA17|nr:hypothetical protein [Hymenobacter sp. BT18]QIX62747.1 hypothetical protein HER32_16830 [Hymenobacter sp. BT18]
MLITQFQQFAARAWRGLPLAGPAPFVIALSALPHCPSVYGVILPQSGGQAYVEFGSCPFQVLEAALMRLSCQHHAQRDENLAELYAAEQAYANEPCYAA